MCGARTIRFVITKRGSRIVYRNRWMTVREDEVELADGSSGIYGVVEKVDFALVIPFDGEAFHLVEQYRYPVDGRYLEFPQGSWEHDPGAEMVDVAHGELEEETGLRAARMDHLGRLFKAYGYSTQALHVFMATELEQGEQRLSIEEAGLTVVRLSEAELEAYIRSGRIADSSSLAAWALYRLSRQGSRVSA
jgi:8-oxo-dGTP pyrophosphatase MutT (NUDIX family)